MKRWPLRWQITLWSVLITGLALVTFGAVVAFNLYSEQVEVVDTQLATDARFAFTTRAQGGDHGPVNPDWLAALPKADASLFGFVVGRTTSDRAALEARPETLRQALAQWPPVRRRFTRRVEGKKLRFGVFTEGETRLVLAASLAPVEESVGDLLGAYLIALPAVLLVVAGGSWWIARRALVPVTNITAAAASITADRLDQRLPAPATEDEIVRHIQVLNGMFDRLQRSFEQASRFTADAAHELRTPLTIMRGQIEDALRSGNFTPDQQRLLVGLPEENTGLQRISSNLLLLARFDAGKSPLERVPVDLSALVEEAREDAELLAASQHIRISGRIEPGLRVSGDAVMLRRVALNLVDNAVKFNRDDGELGLSLRTDAAEVVLSVANTGPGIPPDRQGTLFQRFYRADSGRNRDTGGSGLGLSLCREIVTALGGRIELARSDGEWTEFTVRLPRLGSETGTAA
ncbi:MAG: ATP-binding protein [Pseudomonadota bacterium]